MSEFNEFVEQIVAEPDHTALRMQFSDWLRENDRWKWETVRGLVLEHPGSDQFRLLAADWFFEDGQYQRAQFIQCQCRIAELVSEGVDRQLAAYAGADAQLLDSLRQAEQILLNSSRNAFVWREELIQLLASGSSSFSRGFPSTIWCRAEEWNRESGQTRAVATPEIPVVEDELKEDMEAYQKGLRRFLETPWTVGQLVMMKYPIERVVFGSEIMIEIAFGENPVKKENDWCLRLYMDTTMVEFQHYSTRLTLIRAMPSIFQTWGIGLVVDFNWWGHSVVPGVNAWSSELTRQHREMRRIEQITFTNISSPRITIRGTTD